jgi:signal transduction histidine kinase
VNNSVAGIAGSLSDDERERLLALSKFVTRFAEVVKLPRPQLLLCDLSEEVDACRPFLESLCTSSGITVSFSLADDAIPVQLDVVLFQQVLINIVKNAVESIGKATGRRVSGNATQGLVTLEVTTPATLTITDNGHGIPPAIAKNLFTPFFSTKPQGQGLGLLLIRDILTSHHCTFNLLTDPEDHLTRFTIQFPIQKTQK